MLTDGQSKPIWYEIAQPEPQESLTNDLEADVCIVGGGIAGLTTAYLLGQAGKRVVVLESKEISGGQTGRSTAQLANWVDDEYGRIRSMHGERVARIVAESFTRAIDELERISKTENIDCDFERLDAYLFMPTPEDNPQPLLDELEESHRAGITNVERVEGVPMEGYEKAVALKFSDQAQFDPLRYLNGLAQAIKAGGGRIFTNVLVKTVESEGDDQKVRVTTEQGQTITADYAVVATNSPINDRVAIHTKQAPYRTYVVGLRVPRGSVEKALYWDLGDPYHYVRLQAIPDEENADYDVLIVGGEDHKTGQADDAERRYQNLEKWTRERFPQAGAVEFQWSGQVMEPVDGVAFIGRNPLDAENVFVVTGDSGQGTSHGTIAGMLLRDMILGNANEDWVKLYDPSRKTVSARSIKEFVVENLDVAAQYTDLVTGGEVESIDEIAAGEGAIMRDGLKKLAVYKDETGAVQKLSAVCTHLGCIVQWNSGEKTWDCPCHGSRFAADGEVVEGPAQSDLERINEQD
ncbi:MAG TPA: FAD-dependent oxidoreductase [Pyrinomonadaceae bacterium]|nr:FAD-dependent oxidoreductase [Pyrinomonadaceae bacterium]